MAEKNANKIKYGLSNVHYALIKEDGTTYDTPKPIPGAVNLSLSAEGESNPFYADDIIYYNPTSNNGYSGDLEVAMITDEFKIDVLGYEKDEATGLLIENADPITVELALLFEIKGDKKKRRNVFYKVSPGRPGEEHSTKAESVEPKTDTLPITIIPTELNNKMRIRASVYEDEKSYEDFYSKVVVPGATAEA